MKITLLFAISILLCCNSCSSCSSNNTKMFAAESFDSLETLAPTEETVVETDVVDAVDAVEEAVEVVEKATEEAVDSTKTELELKMEALGLIDIATIAPDIPVSLMYARADNFTGKIMYKDLNRAYLDPEAAKALVKAQAELKRRRPDLSLKVYDAARPMSVQQIMWDVVAGTPEHIYVSNPAKGGGLHNYGLAVDVTLCEVATGDTLTMGAHIDYFGLKAQPRHEATMLAEGKLSQEAIDNRVLLREVMVAAGYMVLRSEWWHFNFKTRQEARENYAVIP